MSQIESIKEVEKIFHVVFVNINKLLNVLMQAVLFNTIFPLLLSDVGLVKIFFTVYDNGIILSLYQ